MTKKDLLSLVKQFGKPHISICNFKMQIWEKDRYTIHVSWGRDFKLPEQFKGKYYQTLFSVNKGSIEAKTFFTMAKAKAFKAKLEGWINE